MLTGYLNSPADEAIQPLSQSRLGSLSQPTRALSHNAYPMSNIVFNFLFAVETSTRANVEID